MPKYENCQTLTTYYICRKDCKYDFCKEAKHMIKHL